jgi:hypothetical protein
MTFAPGQSGNPAGRPRGARNRQTIALEALLDEESEAVMQEVIGLAKLGDDRAMRLCVERMPAPQRERPVTLRLPRIYQAKSRRRALLRCSRRQGRACKYQAKYKRSRECGAAHGRPGAVPAPVNSC